MSAETDPEFVAAGSWRLIGEEDEAWLKRRSTIVSILARKKLGRFREEYIAGDPGAVALMSLLFTIQNDGLEALEEEGFTPIHHIAPEEAAELLEGLEGLRAIASLRNDLHQIDILSGSVTAIEVDAEREFEHLLGQEGIPLDPYAPDSSSR
jgi:hypothetical protein